MTLTNVVRRALRERGYVESEERDAMYVSIWADGQRVACSFASGWLFRGVVDALAEDAIEARAVSVTIDRLDNGVGEADVVQVHGGEVDVTDKEDEANEILFDWTEGGGSYDEHALEVSLAYALLDVDEPDADPPERESLRFARDPEVAAEAEARALARAAAKAEAEARAKEARARPAEWKRFRHPDGRRWAVRARANGYDLEMTDEEGDVFTRSREQANAGAAVALLIVEQLGAGFVDEP
jgi:hypothetical protein